MIKKLFLLLFILILIVVLSPFALLASMYQGNTEASIPVETYIEGSTVESTIAPEIDLAIEGLNSEDGDLVYRLRDETLNQLIFAAITEEGGLNPNYNPSDDCEEDDCNFILVETIEINESSTITIRIKGVWVLFDENQLILNANGEVQYNDGFTYKSKLSLYFDIEDREDAYYFAFDKVTIGRLPLGARFFARVLDAAEQFTGETLTETDTLPIGEIDLDNFSVTIPKQEIVDTVRNDEDMENSAVIAELLSIIFDNTLLSFAFEENEFNFTLKSSLFLNDPETAVPSNIQAIYDSEEPFNLENYLTTRLEEFVLSQALINDGIFRINENIFNTLIASNVNLEDFTFEQSYENPEGVTETVSGGIKGIWIDIESESIFLYILIQFEDVKSLVTLELGKIESEDAFTLVYEVVEFSVGKDASETSEDYLSITEFDVFIEAIKDNLENDFLSINASNQFVVGGPSLETMLNDLLLESGISLNDIDVVNNAIALNLELDESLQSIFDDVSSAINTVLENETIITSVEEALAESDSEEAAEVVEAVTNIQNKLENQETITEEDVSTLIDEFTDLTPEEQQNVLNAIQEDIDPELLAEFEALFSGQE